MSLLYGKLNKELKLLRFRIGFTLHSCHMLVLDLITELLNNLDSELHVMDQYNLVASRWNNAIFYYHNVM